MVSDRQRLDRRSRAPEQDGRAPDHELADAPFAEPAADDDAPRVAPRREFQETRYHFAQRMGKLLDGADQHAGRDRIAVQQDFFQLLLLFVELLRRKVSQRIGLSERAAPAIQDRLERLLVGAVAQKRTVVPELDVVVVDAHRAQLARAVWVAPTPGER